MAYALFELAFPLLEMQFRMFLISDLGADSSDRITEPRAKVIRNWTGLKSFRLRAFPGDHVSGQRRSASAPPRPAAPGPGQTAPWLPWQQRRPHCACSLLQQGRQPPFIQCVRSQPPPQDPPRAVCVAPMFASSRYAIARAWEDGGSRSQWALRGLPGWGSWRDWGSLYCGVGPATASAAVGERFWVVTAANGVPRCPCASPNPLGPAFAWAHVLIAAAWDSGWGSGKSVARVVTVGRLARQLGL